MPQSTLVWPEQIIVVTGGSGGMGKMIVDSCARKGASVISLDISNPPSTTPKNVFNFKCDLTNALEVEEVLQKVQKEIGNPSILINNAGVVQGKLLIDLSRNELEQTFNVNVLAHFTLLKILLPSMISNKRGHVVTVSSVFGLAATSQLADYSASKHAVIGLHEALRYELKYKYRDPPIRTTLLVPGQVRTPLFASLAPLSWAVSILAPIVHPQDISDRVISALDREQSQDIYLPFYGSVLWAVRGMPSWFQDGLVWFSGANDAMTDFVKAEGDKLRNE